METPRCDMCNEELQEWETTRCEKCDAEHRARQEWPTIDSSGKGFQYLVGLDDCRVMIVCDSAQEEPLKVLEAFSRAGIHCVIMLGRRIIGEALGDAGRQAEEQPWRFVSVYNGDRGKLFDASGAEIPHALCADLKTGWVGQVERGNSRVRTVFRRFPHPLNFEERTKEPCSTQS